MFEIMLLELIKLLKELYPIIGSITKEEPKLLEIIENINELKIEIDNFLNIIESTFV